MPAELNRVVVTGATRGIGRAIVDALLSRGAAVVAVGRDAKRLKAMPARVSTEQVDLVSESDWDTWVADIVERHGAVDGLVNCAGVIHYEAWDRLKAPSIEEQIAVNLLAPLGLSRSVANHWRNQESAGSIVNVSSTLADRAAERTMVYSATKAALNSVTRGLALELAPLGIRVNAVLPGIVHTDMIEVPRGGDDVAAQLEALAALHPLGRLGTPAEVAEVVVQTLHNHWQTGSLVTIDGGLTLR